VFAPTLTGLGERSHLSGPDIDLALHTEDVVNVIRFEGLEDVALVGHSYGGMVITGVADVVPDAIGSLVYLDAHVPEDGESMQDLTDPTIAAARTEVAARTGFVPPVSAAEFGVNPADREWVDAMCVPQPAATITQPLALSGGIDRCSAVRAYIVASRGAPGRVFPALAARLRTDPDWIVHEIESGHDVMIDAPGELARLLCSVVADRT
jgi:pimeloyl-ACP methyl ester carboxylesterase